MRPLRTRLEQARKDTGMGWAVLERDYLLSWILAAIGNNESLSETLVFKGGTALKKCLARGLSFQIADDFFNKKMLAYVIVAEVGYMVGGAWLGNRTGMTGAILHIFNDALMTFCVFLVAGNIVYKVKGHSFEELRGLFHRMPFTMGAFVIGALSIIGVPPTCGFFSKWYLISGAIEAGHYGFLAALLFSSLINVVLFFRVIEIAYYEPMNGHHGEATHHSGGIDDAPLTMLVPLFIVTAGLVLVGLYTGAIVEHIIQFAIPKGLV